MDAQKVNTSLAIRDLIGKESKLLGSSEEQDRFALVSPVGTVIRSARPTFRWQSLPGASSYSVAILDSQLNVVEQGSPTGKANWTPLQPLKRNVVYIWQVTALKDGREVIAPAAPAREARFKILSAGKAATLAPVPGQSAWRRSAPASCTGLRPGSSLRERPDRHRPVGHGSCPASRRG